MDATSTELLPRTCTLTTREQGRSHTALAVSVADNMTRATKHCLELLECMMVRGGAHQFLIEFFMMSSILTSLHIVPGQEPIFSVQYICSIDMFL
jgi:hypothetical protein